MAHPRSRTFSSSECCFVESDVLPSKADPLWQFAGRKTSNLLGGKAAVNGQTGTGDETGFRTGEVSDHGGDLVPLAVTFQCHQALQTLGKRSLRKRQAARFFGSTGSFRIK